MSLTFGLSPWLLAALLLASLGGAVWLYRGTVPLLQNSSRRLLSALRFCSLAILVFLLVEPLLGRESVETDAPVVVLLLDDSQSVGILDQSGQAPGIQQSEEVHRNLTEALPSADIRIFHFGGSLTEEVDDSSAFKQPRTDISAAVTAASEALREENVAGFVVVSDGRYNTGRNPIHVAGRFPWPLHTVTVGDTTSRRDVQVRRILTNDVAYREVTLPLDVGVQHRGFGGERVTVRVMSQGVVLDQQQLDLPAQDGETTVRLRVLPDTTGLVRYDVSVSRSEGEYTFLNNTDAVSVQVLESKQKILLLGGSPSPDLTAIRAVLAFDEDAQVDVFVRNPAGSYFQGTFPNPEDYDLAVLVGYPSSGTPVADLNRLVDASNNGLELLFMLDHGLDLRLTRQLRDAIPVQPRIIRTGRNEGMPVLTSAGARHPIFNMEEDVPSDLWTSLPPLTFTDTSWRVAPDANILATTSIRGISLDDPAVVVRRRTGARSAAFLAYSGWRWHNLPQSLTLYERAWPALVTNLVQWLSAPEDDRPVRVRPDSPSFGGGEPVSFSGQVYDESANPVSGATVDIQVTVPDGSILPFAMRSVGSGRYRADLGTLPEGVYSYQASAQRSDTPLGTDNGTFSIGPLRLEFRDLTADPVVMRQIAWRSGGTPVFPGEVERLADSIRATPEFQPRTRTVQSSIRLWQRLPFLILVLTLLTVEWFLRKRGGLV